MKVAITAVGETLDSAVDPRFGRCRYFIIIDTETMGFEAIENESAMGMGGAGPQAAQAIFNKGARVVITGNVGPNAFQVLKAAGITVLTGASGTVREMVARYMNGELTETDAPTVSSHAGIGSRNR
ncbi:MAG: NifB/NifX family molybdenum-iron cluster-binding protein [Candidatus Thermoplasmatota archaeon]